MKKLTYAEKRQMFWLKHEHPGKIRIINPSDPKRPWLTGTEYFRVSVNKGGHVIMSTWIVSVLTMHELLPDWIERQSRRAI